MVSIQCVIFLAFWLISAVICVPIKDTNDGLVLVHTLFRHGNRTIKDNIYDLNPYGNESFYAPYGYAQLTKEGKRTEFKIGQALRERYDSFLGSEYNINLIDARSTNVNRTKMSLLLVLASLFPPTQNSSWNDNLQWQPIPYNTFDIDKELYGRKVCTNYKKAYKKLIKTAEIVKILQAYQDMFDYLTEHSGTDMQKPKEAAELYLELMTQEAYGYPLENWTYTYIEQMYDITVYNYRLMTYTKKLRKLSTGYLLRKIIDDTEHRITNSDSPTKLYLYSAHETNIALFLATLDVFDDMVPSFGSYVLIEVHRIDGAYGFKFYYQNYKASEPVLLTIPGCDEFCPIKTFKNIVSDYIPADVDCDFTE